MHSALTQMRGVSPAPVALVTLEMGSTEKVRHYVSAMYMYLFLQESYCKNCLVKMTTSEGYYKFRFIGVVIKEPNTQLSSTNPFTIFKELEETLVC